MKRTGLLFILLLFILGCKNFIVMDKTNFGNYNKTLKEIERLIENYGIPYKKNMDIWMVIKQKIGGKTPIQK